MVGQVLNVCYLPLSNYNLNQSRRSAANCSVSLGIKAGRVSAPRELLQWSIVALSMRLRSTHVLMLILDVCFFLLMY